LNPSPLIELFSSSDEELAYHAPSENAAFSELYQRHFPRVYRYHLIRTGEKAEAEDLTAQTFLAALEGIGSYRGSGPFAAWLMGIAHNKMAMYFRQRKNETALDEVMNSPDPADHPERLAGQRLQLAQVSQALERLTPERAEAIMLYIFADLSAAETGNVMGKSEAAVKMLVLRGLRELREQLHPVQEEER